MCSGVNVKRSSLGVLTDSRLSNGKVLFFTSSEHATGTREKDKRRYTDTEAHGCCCVRIKSAASSSYRSAFRVSISPKACRRRRRRRRRHRRRRGGAYGEETTAKKFAPELSTALEWPRGYILGSDFQRRKFDGRIRSEEGVSAGLPNRLYETRKKRHV